MRLLVELFAVDASVVVGKPFAVESVVVAVVEFHKLAAVPVGLDWDSLN